MEMTKVSATVYLQGKSYWFPF